MNIKHNCFTLPKSFLDGFGPRPTRSGGLSIVWDPYRSKKGHPYPLNPFAIRHQIPNIRIRLGNYNHRSGSTRFDGPSTKTGKTSDQWDKK